MQTKIKWNLFLQAIEEREKIKRELEDSTLELARIRVRLSDLSHLKLQKKKIKQLEEQIEKEEQYCLLFANTIAAVCRLYQTNETRLVDYSEIIGRTTKKESFFRQNLEGLQTIFWKVFL